MLRKETVSVQLNEIEKLIKDAIRKKYGFDNTVDFHRTSKTTFLTYFVIRNGDIEGCNCQDCECRRLQDRISNSEKGHKKMKVEIIDDTNGAEDCYIDTTANYVKGTVKIEKIRKEKGDVEKVKGKGPKLKENMFPMMVLEKLMGSDSPLRTQSFFDEYDKTDNSVIHVRPRDSNKWRLDSVRIRLRQMKLRGLIEREAPDLWTITHLGEIKLQMKKKRVNT